MKLRVAHVLGSEEALRRLLATASEHDIRIEQNSDQYSGRLQKSAGFLGSVKGEFIVGADHITVTVIDSPAMIPDETVRRMIVDELAGTFA